jgi:hypothetical protein
MYRFPDKRVNVRWIQGGSGATPDRCFQFVVTLCYRGDASEHRLDNASQGAKETYVYSATVARDL